MRTNYMKLVESTNKKMSEDIDDVEQDLIDGAKELIKTAGDKPKGYSEYLKLVISGNLDKASDLIGTNGKDKPGHEGAQQAFSDLPK